MMTEHDGWEFLEGDDEHGATIRMRVPGGWLYHVVTRERGKLKNTALAFVPDASK